ncbi:hypothetical protein ABK040_013730 [Willaertia magna]
MQTISLSKLHDFFQQERKVDSEIVQQLEDYLIKCLLEHNIIKEEHVNYMKNKIEKDNIIHLVFHCFKFNFTNLNELKFILNFFFFLFTLDDRMDNKDSEISKDLKFQEMLIQQLTSIHVDNLLTDSSVKEEDKHVKFLKYLYIQDKELTDSCKDNNLHYNRFNKRVNDYLKCGVLESCKFNEKEITRESYLNVRMYDSGCFSLFSLVELVCMKEENNYFFLSEEEVNHELIKKAELSANIVSSLMNDIVSYHKEILNNNNPISYLTVTMNDLNIELKETVEITIDELYKHLTILESLSVDENLNENQKKYICGLLHFTKELCVWHCHSKRYRHPQSMFKELQ